MDKYEFNIKVEQIRKLVNKGDYETAMKISDNIDWSKVRNANLLSMVADVYEKNKEYQEAKDILLLAFERAPIGKRLLYKLTKLALKEGNVEEAEAYYREFCDLTGDDPRQQLLRYMILKQKHAPVEQLIHSLESYTSEELDEKWMYELAELYHQAGDEQRCVGMCDKIMLMFGLGKYVDKAMDLKQQYAPLTQYQMDLVENRDKYEEKLRAVERSFKRGTGPEDFPDAEPEPLSAPEVENSEEAYLTEETEFDAEPEHFTAEENEVEEPEHFSMEENDSAEPESVFLEEIVGGEPDVSMEEVSFTNEKFIPDMEPLPLQRVYEDGNLAADVAADVKQAESEEMLAEEMSRIGAFSEPEDESELGKTRVLHVIRRAQPEEIQLEEVLQEEDDIEETEEEPELPKMTNHLMIEARTPEKGLEMAIQALKQIQQETGIRNPVAKISAAKLNQRGVLACAPKLAGKDLMVEEAGDLLPKMLKELELLMNQDDSGMRIVLIDNPKQMEMLHAQNPVLAAKFECIGSREPRMTDGFEQNDTFAQEMPAQKPVAAQKKFEVEPEMEPTPDDRPVRHITPTRDSVTRIPSEADRYADEHPADEEAYEDAYDVPEEEEVEDEMDIDEFAQYACRYASEIDCSITGKSMLALYERIEIMEEEGIALIRANAEALIEEAADKAEKPSFFKRLKGLFSSKYDKEGLLILREEHFI